MRLYKVERPKGYTGPITESPNKEFVCDLQTTSDVENTLESLYDNWAAEFFKRRPRGTLNPSFGKTSAVVRGTGDNGMWLVSWFVESD